MNLRPFTDLWVPLQPVLYGMERQGFPVDLEHFARVEEAATAHLGTETAQLDLEMPGVNPRSPPQVNKWLRAAGVPPSPVTKKGPAYEKESTDGAALEYLADHYPAVSKPLRRVLHIRKVHSGIKYAARMRYHAVQGADDVQRVHCNITRAAATGRLGAARPELHQIPKNPRKDLYGIRAGFVASPHHKLVVVDQSQLEMRILAHYLLGLAKPDNSMALDLEAEDCHSSNAIRVFAPLRPYLNGVHPSLVKTHADARVRQCRDDIKEVIYGMNYGKGDTTLGVTLRDEFGEPVGRTAARKVMDGIFSLYPGLADYHQGIRLGLLRDGGVGTLLGRFRPLQNPRSNRAFRQGINTPMQGGGADIMDRSLLLVSQDRRLAAIGYRSLVTVHDEIVGEAPVEAAEEAGRIVAHHMETAVKLRVPLKATVGVADNWLEAH